MKLAKEPVDFVIKSESWSDKESADFSVLIQEIKIKNKRRKTVAAAKSTKPLKADKSL